MSEFPSSEGMQWAIERLQEKYPDHRILVGGWQPIETAPKEYGVWILLYAPPKEYERLTGQVYVATWEPISYNRQPQWVYGAGGPEHGFRDGVYDATHWMPLPEPPNG